MSFAQFELRAAADGSQAAARAVYQRSCAALRQSDDKEERLMLMEVRLMMMEVRLMMILLEERLMLMEVSAKVLGAELDALQCDIFRRE